MKHLIPKSLGFYIRLSLHIKKNHEVAPPPSASESGDVARAIVRAMFNDVQTQMHMELCCSFCRLARTSTCALGDKPEISRASASRFAGGDKGVITLIK